MKRINKKGQLVKHKVVIKINRNDIAEYLHISKRTLKRREIEFYEDTKIVLNSASCSLGQFMMFMKKLEEMYLK